MLDKSWLNLKWTVGPRWRYSLYWPPCLIWLVIVIVAIYRYQLRSGVRCADVVPILIQSRWVSMVDYRAKFGRYALNKQRAWKEEKQPPLLWACYLPPGWIYIGRTKRLSTIFMHSYKEPEVVVKCLDIIKYHYWLCWSVKWGGHRGLGLRLLFRYVYVRYVYVCDRLAANFISHRVILPNLITFR